MYCFRIDLDGKLLHLENFSEAQAFDLLKLHKVSYVDKELSVGVARSNEDFVDFSCYGDPGYNVHTDTLCDHRYHADVRLSFWRKLFSMHPDLDLEVTEEQAFDILGVYINGTRKEFEDYLASLKYPNKRWARL